MVLDPHVDIVGVGGSSPLVSIIAKVLDKYSENDDLCWRNTVSLTQKHELYKLLDEF
jgi:hypothetical protein